MSNLFSTSPAVIGSLLAAMVALPILIHLINRVRHRTVKWAAMDFLMVSHKKTRSWVWLKQWMLLVARIAALLVALMMLTRLRCDDAGIGQFAGVRTTHHYVLLDDSFSMSQQDSNGSAFDRALETISRIAAQAQSAPAQRVTLIRFSKAEPASADADAEVAIPWQPDIDNELADSGFSIRVANLKGDLATSTFPATIRAAAALTQPLIASRSGEDAVVYVLSDFREHDWESVHSETKSLVAMRQSGAEIRLVDCATAEIANVAITDLKAIGNLRVAGTPLMMQVDVENFGEDPIDGVQIQLSVQQRSDTGGADVDVSSISDDRKLPTAFIERIEPGSTGSAVFPIIFPQPGSHSIRAELTGDAVAIDDLRFATVAVTPQANVLIVDNPAQTNGSFLSLALNPGGMTGIVPEVRTREFLRDADNETMDSFDAVLLCDPGPLDPAAIDALESFADRGGGVAFFVGPETSPTDVNLKLYRNGAGIFPVALDQEIEIPELESRQGPDIVPRPHPVFAPVTGMKNSLLDLVQIDRVFSPTQEWLDRPPAHAETIATVRGDAALPLVVIGRHGGGHTAAILTTAGAQWNNWMRNATFPPILLLLEDYLARGKHTDSNWHVGDRIVTHQSATRFLPSMKIVVPAADNTLKVVEREMMIDADGEKLTGTLQDDVPHQFNAVSAEPGVYEFWFRTPEASDLVERIAVNVDSAESDLTLMSRTQLMDVLQDADPQLVGAEQFSIDPDQHASSSLNRLLLLLMAVILIAEPLLAWSTSYHH